MKVWLDSNYNIVRDDGCNKFTKGNNLYDRITICLLTESMANDNTLPHFNFLLANGRKYGPLVHNTNSTNEVVDDVEYTVITYELTDNLLSCEGPLQITITINWYNDENKVLKSKNINLVGNVINSVVVADDIIILGNEEGIVRTLVEDMNSLDERLTDGLIAIDKADKDSQGNVIHETYETKENAASNYTNVYNYINTKYNDSIGHTDTSVDNAQTYNAETYETKVKVLELINELKNALLNGTITVSKAYEAVYYTDNGTMKGFKATIDDIYYLINELTNTDLTGLLNRIQVLETAWNKFMSANGDTADVIDTLNEIQTALSSNSSSITSLQNDKVDKEEGKSLIDDELIEFVDYEYEKGLNLFDYENRLVNKGLNDIGQPIDYTDYYVLPFVKVEPNSQYTMSRTHSTYIAFYDQNQNFISVENQGATFTTSSNCYYVRKDIEYTFTSPMLNEGTTALPYKPYNANKHITNQEANFLKEESLKSANLYNNTDYEDGIALSGNGGTYSDSSSTTTGYIRLEPNKVYRISTLKWLNFYDSKKNFISQSSNPVITMPSNAYYIKATVSRGTIGTIMLNEGSTALPYKQYQGKVTREIVVFEGSRSLSTSEYFQPLTPNILDYYAGGIVEIQTSSGVDLFPMVFFTDQPVNGSHTIVTLYNSTNKIIVKALNTSKTLYKISIKY